jgi:hypothetical protein
VVAKFQRVLANSGDLFSTRRFTGSSADSSRPSIKKILQNKALTKLTTDGHRFTRMRKEGGALEKAGNPRVQIPKPATASSLRVYAAAGLRHSLSPAMFHALQILGASKRAILLLWLGVSGFGGWEELEIGDG